MMKDRSMRSSVDAALAHMRQAGATRSQCIFCCERRVALTAEQGEIGTLATRLEQKLHLQAHLGERCGVETATSLDKNSLREAAESAIERARRSSPDPARAIACTGAVRRFASGNAAADPAAMLDFLQGFQAQIAGEFPSAACTRADLTFVASTLAVRNTAGTDLESRTGEYRVNGVFTRAGSPGGTSFARAQFRRSALDRPLLDCGGMRELLRRTMDRTPPSPPPAEPDMELVVAPQAVDYLLSHIRHHLSDAAVLARASLFAERLGRPVADPVFTLHSLPRHPAMQSKVFITPDGFEALDATIIREGVLASLLLSQAGARRTGYARAPNPGGRWVVAPGTRSSRDLVADVACGVLLGRLSGTKPDASGDFSGVAKNSFLIRDGRIRHPLEATTVSGNLAELLRGITAVSSDRIDFGDRILPWIRVGREALEIGR